MKVKSATVRLCLKKSRANANGEYPVYLVVCYHGRVEKSTTVSVSERYWDKRRECVKGCANAALLNKELNAQKAVIIARRDAFEVEGREYTAKMLLSDCGQNIAPNSALFSALCERVIGERRLGYNTRLRYGYCQKKLSMFLGRDDFRIDELVIGVMKDFCKWCESCGLSGGTIKSMLGVIASVWNYAISRKVISGDGYPFDEFKYCGRYRDGGRDYALSMCHMVRLRDYFLNMVINRNGKRWSYKDGAYERLHKPYTKEFALLWFLMMYRMNGSAPIEVALLKHSDCKRVVIGGVNYWAIDIKRRKTQMPVHIRLKRDILTIIGLEHFLGDSIGYVYPICTFGREDEFILSQSHKRSYKAIHFVREAFSDINGDIIRNNMENGLKEPLVEVNNVVMYTARHSFATIYLSSAGSTVNGLASLMGRSPEGIGVYIKQITMDEDIASMVDAVMI